MSTPAGMFRCYNCERQPGHGGKDFIAPADKPTCPTCGCSADDPITARFIERLVVVHYEAPHARIQEVRGKAGHGGIRGPVGTGHLACDKSKPTATGHAVYSGEPTAVNCPACRETEAFKQANAGSRLHPSFNLPMHIDANGDLQFDANADGIKLKPAMVEETV